MHDSSKQSPKPLFASGKNVLEALLQYDHLIVKRKKSHCCVPNRCISNELYALSTPVYPDINVLYISKKSSCCLKLTCGCFAPFHSDLLIPPPPGHENNNTYTAIPSIAPAIITPNITVGITPFHAPPPAAPLPVYQPAPPPLGPPPLAPQTTEIITVPGPVSSFSEPPPPATILQSQFAAQHASIPAVATNKLTNSAVAATNIPSTNIYHHSEVCLEGPTMPMEKYELLSVLQKKGTPLMKYDRKCGLCMLPGKSCCSQDMQLHGPDNEDMGSVDESLWCLVPSFVSHNEYSHTDYHIHRKTCMCGFCVDCCNADFLLCRTNYLLYKPWANGFKNTSVGGVSRHYNYCRPQHRVPIRDLVDKTMEVVYEIKFEDKCDGESKARVIGFFLLLEALTLL